jgi:thiosulfate/3-mercaptopyruvate sulfurtransferase
VTSERAAARAIEPIVSTEWLAAHLGEPDLRLVDARWYLPHLKRDPKAEFVQTHIPGAVFFDIDGIADTGTPLPHMLPSAEQFARSVGALGIGDGDRVVVYGARHMIASARVWWTFRVFGHEPVGVLDGGFPKWRAEGRPLEPGRPAPPARRFTASFRGELVADLGRVRATLERSGDQVLDARSQGRFAGAEPEPRPGVRGGHIPGSRNLPYDQLFSAEGGTLLPPEGLERAFRESGLDPTRPVIATCGSGVSAAVLALGLYLLGRREAAVYDGSWTEWGGRSDTPVEP